MPAQTPEGGAVGCRDPGRFGRSRGGCPTATDAPLPIPHNLENHIMDLLCHSPFSDLSARSKVALGRSPGDLLHAVTLHREAERPTWGKPGWAPRDTCGVGGGGVQT